MILALLLAQLTSPTSLNLNQQPVMVQDEGVRQGTVRAITVNCSGAGVTCTQSGSTWTLSVAGGGGGAPTSATYITQTPDATLTNEQAMSLSGNGIVVNTTGTGVLTIYTGASCTNQFIRALSATGAATCASVNLAADVTGTLPQTNGGTGSGALTCAAGERLTSNGTVYSCSAVVTQAYTTVEDETTPLTQRSTIGFAGAGVTCADTAGETVCTIPGGGTSPLTTKGDIFTFTTVDARKPVGTDGQCLKALSSEATGLEWGACAAGGSGLTYAEVAWQSMGGF